MLARRGVSVSELISELLARGWVSVSELISELISELTGSETDTPPPRQQNRFLRLGEDDDTTG